jgi:alcohol dehydrogenase class IV
VFDCYRPEPDAADLEKLLDAVEASSPDLIIGFGGGSAMDLAKLAAVLRRENEDLCRRQRSG